MRRTKTNANLLRGTLDLLILRALSGEARHGYGRLTRKGARRAAADAAAWRDYAAQLLRALGEAAPA